MKERNIGEVFEVNGKWYQCVEANENDNCNACDLQGLCILMQGKQHVGNCMNWRTDNKRTVYKKLEKVGEQFLYKGKKMQSYIRATDELICNWNNNLLLLEHGDSDIIDIEIKQDIGVKKQCGDTIFRIIARAKEHLFQATNIAEDKKELEVLDSFLLRCWQMGWLKQYEDAEEDEEGTILK